MSLGMMKARIALNLGCIHVDTTVQTSKLGSNKESDEFGGQLCYNKLLLPLL